MENLPHLYLLFFILLMIDNTTTLKSRRTNGTILQNDSNLIRYIMTELGKKPVVLMDETLDLPISIISKNAFNDTKGLYIHTVSNDEIHFRTSLMQLRKVTQSMNPGTLFYIKTNSVKFLRTFADEALKSRVISTSTSLVILTRIEKTDVIEILQTYRNLRLSMVVVIREYGNRRELLEYQPYPSDKIPGVKCKWDADIESKVTIRTPIFTDKYARFNGLPVDIAALPFPPFWVEKRIEHHNGTKTREFGGLDGLMLNAIAKSLDFSLRLVHSDSWKEVEMHAENGTTMLVPLMYYTYYFRTSRYSFSRTYQVSNARVAMRTPEHEFSWTSLSDPLPASVWIGVLIFFLLSPFVMYMMLSRNRHQNYLQSSLQEAWRMLLCQPYNVRTYTKKLSGRQLILSLMIFSFFLSSAYKSNLIAHLTLPRAPPRMETVKDIYESKVRVTAASYAGALLMSMQESKSKYSRGVAKRMVLGPNVLPGLHNIITNGTGHVEDSETMLYVMALNFPPHTFYLVKESVVDAFLAWLIPHDSLYAPKINRKILQILESGLRGKWTNDILREAARQRRTLAGNEPLHNTHQLEALRIDHLKGPILLWGLCCLLASLIFVVELCV